MSTHNDALIAVAPTATTHATPAVPALPPTSLRAGCTVEEAERALAALFRDHRPGHEALAEIGVMASLADRAVTKAHAESIALDFATTVEDYTNCAALYGYVLGFAAAERARRGA